LGAIGAAMDCYDTLRLRKERIQFDKPIGTCNYKKKLAEMITEITKAQLLT
jgi:alkylation response protein AidB-like acyl-CoA dehydrogenase